MSYKNSVKLLTSNFSLVWKQLLYMLVVCLLVIGVSYGVSRPIIKTLDSAGVLTEIRGIFENIYTAPKEVLSSITNTANHFMEVISSSLGDLWLSITGLFVTLFVVFQILKNISLFTVSNLMFMKMTSFTTIGYTRTLISTLGTSLRFSLAKWVLKIPFALLKFLTLYTFFKTVTSPLSILLGLFAVILVLVVLSSIELSLFTAMAGKLLESGGSAFKAFFLGAKTILKKFARIFSNALVVVLTLVLINVLLGLFTLGVALIITLPASMVFVAVFQLRAYFGAKGDRYYVSSTVIVTPLGEENHIEK